MREIEDFLPQVMPYAPGCAEPVAVQHLRDAAIRLCERTRCWRHIDTFQTTGQEHEILAVPSEANLFEIEWARFNDRLLEPKTPDGEKLFQDNGDPRYITQVNPDCVSIEPHGIGDLTISMFLKPSQSADQLPSFMMSQFARALGDGALSTLLLLPNQPFTNPQMAMVFESKFQTVLDRNFAYNMRGQERARKRTKPSYF